MSKLETTAAIGMTTAMAAGIGVVFKWGTTHLAERWLVEWVNPKVFGVASGVYMFAYLITRVASDILGIRWNLAKKEKLNLKAVYLIHFLPQSAALLAYNKYEKLPRNYSGLFVVFALVGVIHVLRAHRHNKELMKK